MNQLTSILLATVALFPLMAFNSASASSLINVTSIAGDEDCFGTNRIPCSTASINEVISNSEPDDGVFDAYGLSLFEWSHKFTLPTASQVTEATITISTLDLEDAGAGDGRGGGPFDTLLFIDGMEVVGAFDTTFTPDGNAATQLPINSVVFDLNPSFFPSFLDGQIDVALNPRGGPLADVIAIDFAKLEVTAMKASVPEPSFVFSLLLLGVFSQVPGLKDKFKTKASLKNQEHLN